MSGHLKNAPLVYSLVQVKFQAVLSMGKYIPEIQERLRATYPRFRASEGRMIRISPSGQSDQLPQIFRWEFNNKGNDTGFILLNDAFIFHATNYSIFKDFLNQAIGVLKIVNEIVGIALVDRIGMRHIDVVTPSEGEGLELYIKPNLLGFKTEDVDASSPLLSMVQTQAKTEEGTLVLQCIQNMEGESLPADLMPCPLNLRKLSNRGHLSALVDTDHFADNLSLDFDLDQISAMINRLHFSLSKVFDTTFTEHAYKQWV